MWVVTCLISKTNPKPFTHNKWELIFKWHTTLNQYTCKWENMKKYSSYACRVPVSLSNVGKYQMSHKRRGQGVGKGTVWALCLSHFKICALFQFPFSGTLFYCNNFEFMELISSCLNSTNSLKMHLSSVKPGFIL